METNTLPRYDDSDNPTGCCPRFNPEGWDGRNLHFRDKPFVHATTRSVMHVPVNMGRVFDRVGRNMMAAGAHDPNDYIALSRDLSPWEAEHYFAVTKEVPDEDMTTLSGDFVTHVFEGPYREVGKWIPEFEGMLREKGHVPKSVYMFYTTCPKCAEAYGKNYVVGVARI